MRGIRDSLVRRGDGFPKWVNGYGAWRWDVYGVWDGYEMVC